VEIENILVLIKKFLGFIEALANGSFHGLLSEICIEAIFSWPLSSIRVLNHNTIVHENNYCRMEYK
jgi:hypothetical protein